MELRDLPSVDELAREADDPLAVAAARTVLERARDRIRAGGVPGDLHEALDAELASARAARLRRVLNATGVIVHTNLGRAPLAPSAREAVARAAEGYSNLELDLESGDRGSRHAHVEALLRELTGAEAAIVVNNCAAAVLLGVAALGRPVVISRGQLIEIGGGFRIPEVVAQAGVPLVEVGTTNRTRPEDYSRALEDHQDAVVMHAHPSNFRTVGFVEEVPVERLCELGAPVIDDVGSGVLAEELELLAGEPPVRRSVRAGAALVCFSADKLLGGPQGGVIVGRAEAVAAARAHPLARAARLDKLSLAALEATLALYRDPERAVREIPVLAMLTASEEELTARAERMASSIGPAASPARASGRVGGGALPLLELSGPVVAIDVESPGALAASLRAGEPPVLARIADGRVLLDPRTLTDEEAALAAEVVRSSL